MSGGLLSGVITSTTHSMAVDVFFWNRLPREKVSAEPVSAANGGSADGLSFHNASLALPFDHGAAWRRDNRAALRLNKTRAVQRLQCELGGGGVEELGVVYCTFVDASLTNTTNRARRSHRVVGCQGARVVLPTRAARRVRGHNYVGAARHRVLSCSELPQLAKRGYVVCACAFFVFVVGRDVLFVLSRATCTLTTLFSTLHNSIHIHQEGKKDFDGCSAAGRAPVEEEKQNQNKQKQNNNNTTTLITTRQQDNKYH
jgi:hypothetical protein